MADAKSMRLGGVDIGTLTCRLLIADLLPGGRLDELHSERRILLLGEGVDQVKKLSVAAMDRVIACLREWREVIESYGVEASTAVATSAVRDASNRGKFLDRVKREAGFEVEIITGEEEARRTLLGIRSGLPDGVIDVLALDIGGGSTEFILDRPGQKPIVRSIDIGVVRLCERLLHHDPPTDDEVRQGHEWVARETKSAVTGLENYQTAAFVGTAGTITSLAAMAQKLPAYEPARVHNYRLQLHMIQELERTLLSRKKADRIGLPGLEKGREEVIAAGAIIIRTVMETLGVDDCLVSDLGLREGVLINLARRIANGIDVSSKQGHEERARAAWRLSNDLRQDLIAGTQAYRIFQQKLLSKPAGEPVPTAIRRLCLTHLVIALAKWCELYKRYRNIIPPNVTKEAKKLSKEIENRGVVTFRNTVVGHVWDDEAKRALTAQEIEERLDKVLGGDIDAFLLWINDPKEPNLSTVVSVIERVHDQIRNEYRFRDEDLLR